MSKDKFLYRKTNRTQPDGTTKEELDYIGATALLSRSPNNAANLDAFIFEANGKKYDSSSKIYEGHVDFKLSLQNAFAFMILRSFFLISILSDWKIAILNSFFIVNRFVAIPSRLHR